MSEEALEGLQHILTEEVKKERKEIKTDEMSMSVGEIINLYKEGDLILNPAYQRLFRWDDINKTRFIESILLGIPLPSIFVAQEKDGRWVIVDGLQRVSTILQLTGDLKDHEPLKLISADKIPSLEDFTWDNLPESTQRIIKRCRLDLKIINTENSVYAQYELFQRLNTGGMHLEDQEIRNCLIIMQDPTVFKIINNLKTYPAFIKSIDTTENKIEKEYPMELIIRYFIATMNMVNFSDYIISTTIFSTFIDKEFIKIINSDINWESICTKFRKTFDLLYEILGNKAFRKYNPINDKFEGSFTNTAFEILTTGISNNIDYWLNHKNELFEKIKQVYMEDQLINYTKSGVKALDRYKNLLSYSNEYFRAG